MPESSSPLGPYWLLIEDAPVGPFDAATVQTKLAAGQVTLGTLACLAGSDCWVPLEAIVSNWPASAASFPAQPPSTYAKTVLASAPQETQARTVPQAAPSPPSPSRKRSRPVLFASAAVLVSLIVLILAWPKNDVPADGESDETGADDNGALTKSDGGNDNPADKNGKDEAKDYRLRRTKWVGKEQIHKTPTLLEFHFIDNVDVKKISKDAHSKVTLSGDYTVRGDIVTMTFRKKSGKIYERITYVGQIKDGTISGEARVDRGASWKFHVAQTGKKDAAAN